MSRAQEATELLIKQVTTINNRVGLSPLRRAQYEFAREHNLPELAHVYALPGSLTLLHLHQYL